MEMFGISSQQRANENPETRLGVWLRSQPKLSQDYEPAIPASARVKRRKHSTFIEPVTATHVSGSKRRKFDNSTREGEPTTLGEFHALRHTSGNTMPRKPVQGEQSPAKDAISRNQLARQSSPNKKRPATHTSARQDDGYELPEDNRDIGELNVSGIRESPDNAPSFWGNTPALSNPPSTINSSQRSVSPTKAGDFRLTDIKLKYIEGGTVPADGRSLWDDMTQIGFGIAVLPSVMKEKAMKAPGLNPIHPDQHFDPTAGAGPEHRKLWIKAEQIHEAALECRMSSSLSLRRATRFILRSSTLPCAGSASQQVSGTATSQLHGSKTSRCSIRRFSRRW